METSSSYPQRSYTRSEWASLSIQDRIRAMNEINVDTDPPQQSEGQHQHDHGEERAEEDAYNEREEIVEPPRRVSVVEMWRRRDNQSASSATGAPPFQKSPNHASGRIENARHSQEEEKKEEEEQGGPTKPSTVRNMWNQRANKTAPAPQPQAISSSIRHPNTTRSVERTVSATENQVVDMSIVPSPDKSSNEEEPPETVPAPRVRPSNVTDFWAQRGLNPIAAVDSSVTNAVSSVANWKQQREGTRQSSTQAPQHVTAAATPPDDENTPRVVHPSTPGKVSVVDRWKQRIANPEQKPVEEEEAPKSPIKKQSVADRWASAVKKPEPPSPRRNVADRWINRQQQSSAENKAVTPSRRTSNAPIPGIPASPTSRTHTTACSSTGSLRSYEAGPDEEDDAASSAAEETTYTALAGHQHVTKRWSNRLVGEGCSSGQATITPANPRSVSGSSSLLPAPRRKGDGNQRRVPEASHDESSETSAPSQATPPRKIKMPGSFHYTSPPVTPKSNTQTAVGKVPRTPDSKTSLPLPDLKSAWTTKSSSLPLRPQRADPQTPKLPNFQPTTPTSRCSPNLPDFNNLLSDPGRQPPSPLSPSRRSVASLSPKFAYEHSGTNNDTAGSNSLPTLTDFPSDGGNREPRLLVLVSGQSFSRGQASVRQHMATILNGHKIPYEEIDGSIPTVRHRRNELFKLSGLWAVYPQFFVRENGKTIFWGTWDTLQQCNDAGKIEEEFASGRAGRQSSTTAVDVLADAKGSLAQDPENRLSRIERIKNLNAKKKIPDLTSDDDFEPAPPLLKSRSKPDDDDERVSMTSPSRDPKPNYNNLYDLRKIAPNVTDISREKRGQTIANSGRKPTELMIDEKSPPEQHASVNMDRSVNGESVTVQTVEESIATESTAPRLGAKSLDSLERKECRENGDGIKDLSTRDGKKKNKIVLSDMHAMLKPTTEESGANNKSTQKIRGGGVLTSWPPPKSSLNSSPLTAKGVSSRILAPHISSAPRGQISPVRSRASTPVSSQTSGPKMDFSSPRSRRIGQRLIDKKRELQAQRHRIKKSRSSDSNDVSSVPGDTVESLASRGSDVVPGAFQSSSSSVMQRHPRTPQGAKGSESNKVYPAILSASTPTLDNVLNQGPHTPSTPTGERSNTENNPMCSSNLSRHNESLPSPSKNAPWSTKSAFSPLNDRSPRPGIFQPTHAHQAHNGFRSAPSTPVGIPVSSPKDVGSPNSDSGLSLVDKKSDCSNSVASRGSALSQRAEKLLKQRRQKGSLAGVDEGVESAEDRRHAHELARNVVYGHPKQSAAQQSAERVRKWDQLRIDTMGSEDNTTNLSQFPAGTMETDQTSLYLDPHTLASPARQTRQTVGSSSGIVGDTALTRQRASLSSRYTTSDRFIDKPYAQRRPTVPPPSTKSLPNCDKSASAPQSTRSAPGRPLYNGLYSDETQDETPTSSEDFRSFSSQTSKSESVAPVSRPSMTVTSGMDSTFDQRSSHHGIHDDFVTESAYSYDALRNAYANMTFGQLAADFAGEVSSALNLDRIQHDVKKVFGGSKNERDLPERKRPVLVCTDLVPYDEEDVAIEVEYMDQPTSYGLCEAKGCGVSSPTGQSSFEEPPRRRRMGEV